jgi:hemolysin III
VVPRPDLHDVNAVLTTQTPPGLGKPLLRGWSHGAAAAGAPLVTALLLARTGFSPRLAPVLIFCVSTIELYAVSATLHLGNWRKAAHRVLRALDHASIYVAVASAYTPLCVSVLRGWERLAVLAVVWAFAVAGVGLTLFRPYLGRVSRTMLYVAMGWAGLAVLPSVWQLLPAAATGMLMAGGLCYSVGALVYLRRQPDPAPLVFGYHEVFHLLVIAGNAAVAFVVLTWAMPLL